MSSCLLNARNAACGPVLSPIVSLFGECDAHQSDCERRLRPAQRRQHKTGSTRPPHAAWRVSPRACRLLQSQVTATRTASSFATSGRWVSSSYRKQRPGRPTPL